MTEMKTAFASFTSAFFHLNQSPNPRLTDEKSYTHRSQTYSWAFVLSFHMPLYFPKDFKLLATLRDTVLRPKLIFQTKVQMTL